MRSHRLKPEDKTAIIDRILKGRPIKAVAMDFGISHSYAAKLINRYQQTARRAA